MTPADVLATLPFDEHAYMEGMCYRVFAALRSVYPQAQAWYDPIVGHIYTRIDDKWWDIRGAHDDIPHASVVLTVERRKAINHMRRNADKEERKRWKQSSYPR